MKTIWKFALKTTDTQVLEIPENAQILTIQTQNGSPCLWALVDTNERRSVRTIEIRGTGHPFNGNEGKYIGTYQLQGVLVFHCFERKEN